MNDEWLMMMMMAMDVDGGRGIFFLWKGDVRSFFPLELFFPFLSLDDPRFMEKR